MNIIEYTEEVFKSYDAKGASHALNYTAGLMTSQKKHGKDHRKARFGNFSEILCRTIILKYTFQGITK